MTKPVKYTFFYKNQYNWTLGWLFLKFSLFLRYIVFNLFLFSPDIFQITIANTRNRNNNRTKSQKGKKISFNDNAGGK